MQCALTIFSGFTRNFVVRIKTYLCHNEVLISYSPQRNVFTMYYGVIQINFLIEPDLRYLSFFLYTTVMLDSNVLDVCPKYT